jgi:hypothetical protein
MTFPKRGDEFEAEGAWTIRDPGIMDEATWKTKKNPHWTHHFSFSGLIQYSLLYYRGEREGKRISVRVGQRCGMPAAATGEPEFLGLFRTFPFIFLFLFLFLFLFPFPL